MTILTIVLSFLMTYWLDIIIVFLFLAFMVWLITKGKIDVVKQIIFALVVQAEQQLGSKTGKLKFNHVYAALPFIIKLFFTQKQLYELIESAVTELKKQLDSNKEINLMDCNEEQRLKSIQNACSFEPPDIKG